jgi:hypothetical protein
MVSPRECADALSALSKVRDPWFQVSGSYLPPGRSAFPE